jgi:hypothetical protein
MISMARVNIGLRRAKVLCQMPTQERLDLITQGLPIILESARGFWRASEQLTDAPREAEVLEGFAEEEAAKIMILLDAVRCPPSLISEKIGVIAWNFYDHLARLIYADAQGWKPINLSQLREYVDSERKAHYLEGNMGEYILPNSNLTIRESRLYADIGESEDGVPSWNMPTGYPSDSPRFTPTVLRVAEALSALGIFSRKGLTATAEIWGQLDFRDNQTPDDARRLTEQLLRRLVAEAVPSEAATNDDAQALYWSWQMPMYHLDFRIVDVPLEELLREREATMWYETQSY